MGDDTGPTSITWPPSVVTAVNRSASPAAVRHALDRLAGTHPDLPGRLEDASSCGTVVAVLATSHALTRLLENDAGALAVLDDLDGQVELDHTDATTLAATKERELLRIAARDLTGVDDLEATGAALAALARGVLHGAWVVSGEPPLAVIGMGKLGGDELNYSSDIDVMFVGDGDVNRLARPAAEIMRVAGGCFRVDANLRPEGRNGPLVRTLSSYEAYWERWAEPWEFQALLKARPVAGATELGDAFGTSSQERLWAHPLGVDDLRQIRAMKARTEQEVARQGLSERELKRAPGGIRDIEFSIQLLQLVHGPLDPLLRSPTTLALLTEMGSAGYIDAQDASRLAEAYRVLRTVEHRLQLVDGHQTHTLPDDPAALDRLGRVMGFTDTPDGSAAALLERHVRSQRLAVRSIHERVYFRPLLEAFAEVEGSLSPDAAVARLEAFGFTDAKRTQAAVAELTRGLNRSSRLMQQMLPLLLDWLSSAPDPELGLVVLRNLLSGRSRTPVLVEAFRESPEAARQLCLLVGTSRLLGDIVQHNPDLVERLGDPDRLRTRSRQDLIASADRAVSWRGDADDRQLALRRWKDRHLLGIAARDVLGYTDEIDSLGADLTAVAEAALEVALAGLEPQVPFCVLAVGRFGGRELAYGSDLDVMFVYEPSGTETVTEADRVATRLRKVLHGATPSVRLYEIDADLRPEGRGGPLARSFDGFVQYWDRHAATWERQAMLRARPAAGDRALGERLLDTIGPKILGDGLTAEEEREIRRLKARMERERIPPGEDAAFHLKLGKGSLSDVEWTVQLLQLRHGVAATSTWEALGLLRQHGVIDTDDADVLAESYAFCEKVRNRLFLVRSGPANSLPTNAEQARWLARSLDTSAGELREHYRRVTRRARWVTERLFFGQE
ncbi:MAG: bifunctional [glutamine synthetase] adenylyltransferase/[glutamine synthetase]-adenylyl-L-tyrosine phosphorylase [Acidimicrobiia bacterium]|nr:bifunctional [glutamine synthetase] adenylyltransferase/[glutamine synthetase]-adenylyl-L-tyrosine phosphorylase [Acidimicrobiia bacterium]